MDDIIHGLLLLLFANVALFCILLFNISWMSKMRISIEDLPPDLKYENSKGKLVKAALSTEPPTWTDPLQSLYTAPISNIVKFRGKIHNFTCLKIIQGSSLAKSYIKIWGFWFFFYILENFCVWKLLGLLYKKWRP